MAFTTPTISDVWTRLRNAMRAFLPGTDSWIEPNNLSVAGRSFALVMGEAYSRLLYVYRQIFASTADGYHLEYRHAFEWGISRKAASAAQGSIIFDQISPYATIPAGFLCFAPNGTAYQFLTTAVPDAAGKTSVNVRSVITGSATNLLPNTPMRLEANADYPSISGVSAMVGPEGIVGGADVESDEDLRRRVIKRKQEPPHGGARSDYEEWALSVPGVTRVFVSAFKTTDPNAAHTPLTVYPLFDDTRAYGIPTPQDLVAVAQYIEDRRPVTARVYIALPRAVPVNIQIASLQTDSDALRAAIQTNLAAMFMERVPVVTGENAFTLPQAWIDEAVSRCAGYKRHRLVAPQDDLSFAPGDLPILGSVTFSA